MVTADSLRFFLHVARSGRLNEAARVLGVDHTTVGRRITALEKSFGYRLFDRAPQGWRLTEAGTRLLPRAEAVEAAVTAALESHDAAPDALTGTVRIVAPDGFGAFVITPHLVDLRRRHPDLDVELVTATEHGSVSARHFDVAVTLERPSPRYLRSSELASYDLRLYAIDGYLAASPPLRDLSDLRAHTLISYVDVLLDVAPLRFLSALPHRQHVAIQTNNITGHWIAARSGLGIAPLPTYIGDTDTSLRSVLDDGFTVHRTYWLAVPRDLARMGRVTAVAEFLRDVVATNRHFTVPKHGGRDPQRGVPGGR
ncbi:LysR family transcriptional regulator [Nocardia sp. BSTN01]|uniref:LysR family transcriptional regulator n=1 Tax=Nocardia sp. BSTN01 TaxID=2783665 RepID=UPI00188F9119|nr:LysR family transcriptional regulator [Nocardia sp. BSTN01]MBF5001920.1 LysR family transcriptional regulator [Nocardia sp. BSTN01]